MESEDNNKQTYENKQEKEISKDKMETEDEDTKYNLDKDQKSSKFLKGARIFISNLPFSVTEDKIRNFFF